MKCFFLSYCDPNEIPHPGFSISQVPLMAELLLSMGDPGPYRIDPTMIKANKVHSYG